MYVYISLLQLNTFQLVLVTDTQETFAFFLYNEIEWNAGTDDKSLGDPEFGRSSRGAVVRIM